MKTLTNLLFSIGLGCLIVGIVLGADARLLAQGPPTYFACPFPPTFDCILDNGCDIGDVQCAAPHPYTVCSCPKDLLELSQKGCLCLGRAL
jgi:hypothetical protein